MIQQIRWARGLNPEGGGTQELPAHYGRGLNEATRPPLYRVGSERMSMRAVEDDGPFAGCSNDTQLSFYMGKVAFSWGVRGLVAGVAIGAVGAAVGLWFLGKR